MVVKLPGSKGRYLRTLAPYLAWLTEGESEYGEACVGGGSVLIHVAEKNPDIRLFVNDLDPLIGAFWKVVSDRRMANEFCAMLAIPPTLEERAQSLAREPESTLEKARAAVVLTRTSRSGYLRARMFNGGRDETCLGDFLVHWSPKYMTREVKRYHQFLHGRLTVTQQQAVEFVRDHHQTPLFVDPPYIRVGHQLYRFFPSLAEHGALAAALRACRKTLATYDDCEQVRRMFAAHNIDGFPCPPSEPNQPFTNIEEVHSFVS